MAITGVMFIASFPIQATTNNDALARVLRWGCMIPGFYVVAKSRRLDLLEYELQRCQVYQVENRKDRYVEMLKADLNQPLTIDAAVIEPPISPPQPLDLRALNFHHLMLLASTGWGKSSLVSYLLDSLPGDICVIDPHATPHTWGDLPVLGMGRDYQEIRHFIEASSQEMKERYERRMSGDESYQQLNIVVDEFPAVAKAVDPKKFKEWVQTMLCEARKVQMKLILMSQGKSVKTLGLEGQSELLENLTIIRGGNFATAHARSLKDDLLVDWLKQQKRPAMANDEPLEIPDLSGYNPRFNVKPSTDLMRLLPSYKSAETEVTTQLLEKTVTEPETAVTIDMKGLQQSYGVTVTQINDAIAAIRNGSHSDSKIIKEILGLGGRNYSQGKNLLSLMKEVIINDT